MKIALLNLPMDNNYGGNLQRYALMKILQDMGHEVTHLSLLFKRTNLPYSKYPITIFKYIIKRLLSMTIPSLKSQLFSKKLYEEQLSVIIPFYNKYIKHTDAIYDIEELKYYCDFDVFIVGSDQVWRKNIAHKYLETMFFSYLSPFLNCKRIAYSISLGSENNELSKEEINRLTSLYKLFNNVSVREDSAIKLFNQYRWISPKAEHTLDPTLLLNKEEYVSLIKDGKTVAPKGNLFCYILDITETKQKTIDKISKEKDLSPFYISLKNTVSIEQWLRSFMDAQFVITDSYHGFLFSIIFNKPFHLFKNKNRGNSRFDSICKILHVDLDKETQNWLEINAQKQYWQSKSISYLTNSLR